MTEGEVLLDQIEVTPSTIVPTQVCAPAALLFIKRMPLHLAALCMCLPCSPLTPQLLSGMPLPLHALMCASTCLLICSATPHALQRLSYNTADEIFDHCTEAEEPDLFALLKVRC